jgi:hypothetical protein
MITMIPDWMYLNETCREEGNTLRIGEKKVKSNPHQMSLKSKP